MVHCGLVHCGTPSWFICNGEFSSNTRWFFTIVEKDFNLNYETIHQMETNLCTMDKCHVCNDNECSSKEKNVLVIDLRQIIRSSTKIN